MQKSLKNIQITGLCTNHTEIYYGIPYGTAEKWCNPLPYVYNKDLDCTKKEEIALQLHHGKIEGTTDCLTLDIYTKESAKDLPVFVFLHGGNNQTGSSYGEITGELLVEKVNCVVVCINHRLGFLGFNALPSIAKETGNFTMLDIQLALQWVQQYITIFGGNPSNVALTGFSAGGRNVIATLTSKLFTDLYHKAIPFSGGMTLTDLNTAAKKQAEMMSPLVMEDKNLSKEDAIHYLLQDNDEVKDYLFNISDERLTLLNVGAGIRMAKFPHLFKDDVVFPTTGFDTFINDVPILLLTGTTEFSFFGMKDPYFETLEEPVRTQAINFMNKYGSDFYRIFNGQLSALKLKESNYQSNIYVTEINYGNTTSAYPIPLLGSFHGIFVPMLNPDSSMSKAYDFSQPSYTTMADLFLASLKSFLYTDEPNWPAWDLETKHTAIFDAKDNQGFMSIQNTYTTNQEIIKAIENDPLDETIKKVILQTILNGRWFSDDLDNYFNTPSLW